MKNTKFAILTLLILATPGCVTYTSVKDEPRQKVRFTSAHTAQTFYDAYLTATSPKAHRSIAVGYRLTPPYWHQKLSTENVRFNAAIQSADHNRDRIISAKEASAYGREVELAPSKW